MGQRAKVNSDCEYFLKENERNTIIKHYLNRNNSEKLTAKLKEQAKAILQLNNEKEKLVNENEALKLQLKRMTQGLENASLDKEKIKVSIGFHYQFKKIDF